MTTHLSRLFGPGVVTDQRGQTVAVRSRKQLALFAYLAVEHQLAHSREALGALLWPDESEANARNNLRVTLSRLREPFAGDEARGEFVLADRQNARINPAWISSIDANAFSALIERTRQHRHSQRAECADCQTPLLEAVRLYQGGFLDGFTLDECPAFEEWLFMQRERARVLVLEAYADLAAHAETRGELAAGRGFALRQIEIDPLREPAYRQAMRILARMGQRSDALAIFDRCREVLGAELGIEPEIETRALHQDILSRSNGAGLVTPAGPQSAMAPGNTLPPQLTPFIGREGELEQLNARLSTPAYRLISLVGPGGIGKSRLAIQAAERNGRTFRDGVLFVPLAPVQTADSIPAAIAERMGLTLAAGQLSPAEQLIQIIQAKHLLLVLDNFEHVMGGTELVNQLLRQAPGVVVMITSRERLNLQAEDIFELQGLPTPSSAADDGAGSYAAVRLFVERAHRLDKGFKLAADTLPDVVRICRLVEGFPLAIELAAAWIQHMACHEIVGELEMGLGRLETTLRDFDPHHRSLRATFDASWRLVSTPEQLALLKLSTFRGGFTLEAARVVAGAAPMLLHALRDKSLLRAAGSRRYDMHALVQQFCAETLAAQPSLEDQAQQAHTRYFMTALADQAVALDTRDARTAADRLQPDWENHSTAWRRATQREDVAALESALDGLVRFCNLRGLFFEAQVALEGAVARFEAMSAPVQNEARIAALRCRTLTALAYFAGRRGLENTLELSEKALVLAYKIDNGQEIVANLIIQASAAELSANYPRSVALAENGLRIAQARGLDLQAALCLDVLGIAALQTGQFARANQLFEQVIAVHERTGRIEQRARTAIGYLGSAATEQGRYDVALSYSQRYLESCEAMDDRRNTALALHYLAYLWLRLGYYDKTILTDAQSAARASLIGDREIASLALHGKAWAHRHLGQRAEALACASEAVDLARTLNAPAALGFALTHRAEARIAASQPGPADWDAAADDFRQASAIFHSIGKTIMAYETEIGLADLARRRGQTQMALGLITPILPQLPTVTAEIWDEPVRAYVACVRILRASKDPRAEQLLDQGLHLLECLALNIADHELRQNFLSAVPAHGELRALHLARRDAQAAVPAAHVTIQHPSHGPDARQDYALPIPRTTFFGRERDIAALVGQLSDPRTRLLTLTGLGGVGKTRLALRVAQEVRGAFTDGVRLAELAAIGDALSVASAVAAALGIREQAGVALHQTLADSLRDKRLLLILDNCEQFVEACAALVSQLLAAAPHLTVLATSRKPLHASGEIVRGVLSMTLPQPELTGHTDAAALLTFEAVQLFVDRASTLRRTFELNASNAPAVVRICRRLDGIPLALELAAARAQDMPIDALAEHLDNRLKVLTSADPAAQPRHRTLRALMDWSYDLLSPADQALLRQLSAFSGGWTSEAAEAICGLGGNASISDGLSRLVEHSLVVSESQAGHVRYSLLETIRQYARDLLLLHAESQATGAGHARYYAEYVAQAATHADRPTQQFALDQIGQERENIFAALDWGIQHDADLALAIAVGLGNQLDFWELRGHYAEGRHWLTQLLTVSAGSSSIARAKVMLDAARIELAKPDFEATVAQAEASARLCQELGDERGWLDAQLVIMRVLGHRQHAAECVALAQMCVDRGERLGYQRAVAAGLYELGTDRAQAEDLAGAQIYFEHSIRLWRALGNKLGLSDSLNYLATIFDLINKDEEALALYGELETIYRDLGYRRGLALVQNNMGCLLLKQGELDRAEALFIEGLRIRRELGLMRGYLYSFLNFADLALERHEPARAARLLGAAEALCERLGLPQGAGAYSDYDVNERRPQLLETLGEARLNGEWLRGRALTTSQAVDLALEQ